MRLLVTTTAVCFALMLALHGQQDDLATAPRISLKDFNHLKKTGKTVILDVRSLDSYKAAHIPGAISMPLSDLQQRWKELPRNKSIITYCG
ncbi:MAG TPA: rhodanese-like domain-containing protein [Acidobacteriota bacterium]